MTRSRKLQLGALLAVVAGAGTWGAIAALGDTNAIRAHAVIAGPNGVAGKVELTQAPADADAPEPGVWVVAKVEGLTPGRHGFHIHENGTCDSPAFTTAGGHFDPGPFGSSTPVDANHPYHMGDLPNLVTSEGGVGHLNAETSRVTLSPGPLSLFDANGSAVIVHQNPDLGLTGVVGASGGPRLACGVIVLDD
jgi:Cu-Zn family superoxide dismutase